MGRVAILKIGTGDFQEGFDVSLQIWPDNGLPSHGVEGKLPANLKIRGFYELWRSAYLSLKSSNYSQIRSPSDDATRQMGQITNRASSHGVEACRQLAQTLESQMEDWLKSGGDWQKIRERLIEELGNKTDKLRIIIQLPAKNTVLWKLPWHVWDLLQDEERSDIEVALSSLEFKRIKRIEGTCKPKVRILTVLGNNIGINIQADREEIERLPDVDAVFLDKPQPQDFLKQLRSQQGWDIFLFSGHSETKGNNGRIYINEHLTLEIDGFKNALREAINKGLQIAIFNSCDGLGLLRDLLEAGLYIPVAIVMRERVPDEVAQEFLKEFLAEYASGNSLPASVRRSRDRLEVWDQIWPGVTWLPIICQNPAEVPPTWSELAGISINKIPAWFSLNVKNILRISYIISLLAIIILFITKAKELITASQPLNSSLISAEGKTSNWLLYEDPIKGIRIKHPKDWPQQIVLDDLTGEVVKFIRTQGGELTEEELIISVETLYTPITLEAYKKSLVNQIKRTNQEVKIISLSSTIVAKRSGYKIVYSYQEGSKLIKKMEVGRFNGEKAYSITYKAKASEYAKFLPIAEQMINSFDLVK